MQNFIEWLMNKKAAYKVRKNNAKQEALELLSFSEINVVEFNGKLFVSHKGIPVVAVSNLNVGVEKVIADSRKDYIAWKNKFE